MTNEEAIEYNENLKAYMRITDKDSEYKFLEENYEALDMGIKALKQQRWIPVNEGLPKENEYIGNVCKYYLIQDEYGDMHVAHLSNVGWIPMDSLKAIGNEIIAWKELPQSYKAESEDKG